MKQPLDPKVMIDRYRQEEINALSLIHHLAHVFEFQLELKETGTPGKVCKK